MELDTSFVKKVTSPLQSDSKGSNLKKAALNFLGPTTKDYKANIPVKVDNAYAS